MNPRSKRCRWPAALLALGGLSSCTFGTQSWTECSRSFGPSAIEAAIEALRASPSVIIERWGLCGDGRRVRNAVAPLETAGFDVSQPRPHFEVPSASCIGADREVPAENYEPLQSLEWVCRVADASRSVITGGSLAPPGQDPAYIRSAADVRADRQSAGK